MKKVLIIIAIYIVAVLGVFVGFSFLYNNVPELLDGAEGLYKFNRALYFYLDNLSPIIVSGFIVGFSIEWKKNANNSLVRFSQGMLDRYRNVLFVSLAIILVLTMAHEVCMPSIKKSQLKAEQNPANLQRALNLSQEYLETDRPELAFRYASLAKSIAPKDKAVAAMYKTAKDAVDIAHDQEVHQYKGSSITESNIEKINTPIQTSDMGYSVAELLEKAKSEIEKCNWVNAHYWSSLALKACSGTDTNRTEVLQVSNYAWNMLSNPYEYDNSEEQALFEAKKEGYKALNNGDNLRAYYLYKGLDESLEQEGSDPDITRYLNLARERILTQYFFIDETADMQKMDINQNLHFSICNNDGTKQVVYIKGMMDSNQDGGLVRYLEGLSIVNFDQNGDFTYSLSVPFAKMIGVSVSDFTEEALTAMGVNKKWKFIPMIMLVSVDRQTEGVVSKPEYSYIESGLPYSKLKKHNLQEVNKTQEDFEESEKKIQFMDTDNPGILMLSMPYNDFSILSQVSTDASTMSIPSIFKFRKSADGYGYSSTVYGHSLVYRVTYPLFMLILLIFAGSCAWNYRVVNPKELFHFSWIIVLPFLNIMLSIICEVLMYFSRILDYVLVGYFGTAALFVAIVIYFIGLIIVSIHFLSRTAN